MVSKKQILWTPKISEKNALLKAINLFQRSIIRLFTQTRLHFIINCRERFLF